MSVDRRFLYLVSQNDSLPRFEHLQLRSVFSVPNEKLWKQNKWLGRTFLQLSRYSALKKNFCIQRLVNFERRIAMGGLYALSRLVEVADFIRLFSRDAGINQWKMLSGGLNSSR